MCFSATASFAVAAATAVAGVAALRNAGFARALPMAAIPMLFAAQQALEGVLWLQLTGVAADAQIASLSRIYLLIAEVLWPAWIPLATFLIEPERTRRLAIGLVAALGVAMASYLLFRIAGAPASAHIGGHSIRYSGDESLIAWPLGFYLLCTSGVLFFSSYRMIRLFGAVVAVGFAVSAYAHFVTLISVWCFFAAAASTVLYLHFRSVSVENPVAAARQK
jgi:Family of unknown function (DUF6629)